MADTTIPVSVGQEFAVRLQATPSTGYVWEVQSLPEGIQLSGSDHEQPGGDLLPGNSVTQVFRFQARQVGEHTLTLGLKRPWESSVIATHQVQVKVT